MRRICVLINNSGLGGAERRFGRLFARMSEDDRRTTFVVNAELWQKLERAGVVSGRKTDIWVLAEPCARLGAWLGLKEGLLAFSLRKLDYLVFSGLLTTRYLMAGRCVFHLVLGGVYACLPLMLVRPDHGSVISVVHKLSMMVGVSWAVPLYRLALWRCDQIDALTEAVRADLVQLGLPGDKILVSEGSVVDAERFCPSPEKEPRVVFAGRLVEEKNPLLFVEAIPQILRAVPAAKFSLLGEGPLQSLIERTLDRLNLRQVVSVGFCLDPAPVLANARVFVSLQRTENYPSQSLLEAMACGVAVVATDVGLTHKLVDETVGIRVKADPASVADAVVQLLQHPERVCEMGRRARDRVIRHHSTKTYLEYLGELHSRVAYAS